MGRCNGICLMFTHTHLCSVAPWSSMYACNREKLGTGPGNETTLMHRSLYVLAFFFMEGSQHMYNSKPYA